MNELFGDEAITLTAGTDTDIAAVTAKIDDLLREAVMTEENSPGTSVLVVRNGVTLFRKASGRADVEARVPNTPTTNFRLASVSKQFTAMAILILGERGMLRRSDRLTDFFPGFPAWGGEITVRDLLVHSSGLPDYEDFVPDNRPAQVKDADVLPILSEQGAALFPPGSRFRYSNSAYCLLALIVENITGQSFAAFLAENIFQPLGMTNTVAFAHGVSTVHNRAYGYSPQGAGFARTDQSVTSATLGDGGIYSSIDDYARWDTALDTDTLVSRATREQIFTPQQTVDTVDRQKQSYGFGWFIHDEMTPRRLEHDGTTIGFRNYVIRIPQLRQTVLILMNRNDGKPKELARKIVALLR